MSDNPLDPSPDHLRAVQARAEQLWRADGSPKGRLDDYRERADELLRMETPGTAGQLPNPATAPEYLDEAKLQENLGEFPGARGVDDQGDWRQTPMTREELREGGDPQPTRGDAP